MKQTITILAVLMVALLLVSGFIVAGSMQQAQQLVSKNNQMNELKARLTEQTSLYDELTEKYKALSTAFSTCREERDTLSADLKDALLSVEEANGAVTQQETEKQEAQAAFTLEKNDLSAALLEQQTLAETTAAKLTETEKARDEAIARADALETELSALQVEAESAALKAQQSAEEDAEAMERLKAEGKAFRELLTLWSQASGEETAAVTSARKAFETRYPLSEFRLPKISATEPPVTVAPTPKATAAPEPAETPQAAITPKPATAAPKTTLLPPRTVAPAATLPPVAVPAV